MQAGVVEPADPLDDRQLELEAAAPDAVGDQLGVEGVDEALGRALSNASPTVPIDASTSWPSRSCVNA
jgi:hypothetical protein